MGTRLSHGIRSCGQACLAERGEVSPLLLDIDVGSGPED